MSRAVAGNADRVWKGFQHFPRHDVVGVAALRAGRDVFYDNENSLAGDSNRAGFQKPFK